jgi:hypothetical protein
MSCWLQGSPASTAEATRARALSRGDVVYHPGYAFQRVDEASPLVAGNSAPAPRIGASDAELDGMHSTAEGLLDRYLACHEELHEAERWDQGRQPFVATIRHNSGRDKNSKRSRGATGEPAHGCVCRKLVVVMCRDKPSDHLQLWGHSKALIVRGTGCNDNTPRWTALTWTFSGSSSCGSSLLIPRSRSKTPELILFRSFSLRTWGPTTRTTHYGSSTMSGAG